MRCCFLIFIFLVSCRCLQVFAEENVNEVVVTCSGEKQKCSSHETRLMDIFSTPKKLFVMKQYVRSFLLEGDVYDFKLNVFQKDVYKNTYKIEISFSMKKRINSISFKCKGECDTSPLNSILNLKKGQFLQNFNEGNSIEVIRKYFDEKGFPSSKVEVSYVENRSETNLIFIIDKGEPTIVEALQVDVPTPSIKPIIERHFKDLIGNTYDKIKVKTKISEFEKLVSSLGYYFLNMKIDIAPISNKKNRFKMLVRLDPGPRLSFGFYGNKIFQRNELFKHIKDTISKLNFNFKKESLNQALVKFYEENGYYNTEVSSYFVKTFQEDGSYLRTYFFNIREGERIVVDEMKFVGSQFFKENDLINLFYENSSTLANRDFYDSKYILEFKNVIQRFYYEQGFVFFKISDPYLNFNDQKSSVDIEYRVSEGIKTNIQEINISGINKNLMTDVFSSLKNQVGQPLNIVELDNDLKSLQRLLREKGYYYAQVLNTDPKKILKYSNDYKSAFLNIQVLLGPEAVLNEVVVVGNVRTRHITFTREVPIKSGDFITPEIVSQVFNNISSLGLFSQVDVQPVKRYIDGNVKVDLLIKVKERDFGVFEIAPGYRTDIGLKLSSSLGYNNLQGKNRMIQLKGQVNQRLDFNTIDSRRRTDSNKKLIEYDLLSKFSEPYLFNWPVNFDVSTSASRRRFYSFDANILRLSTGVIKQFGKHFKSGLKYQYETISQFNASENKDNDNFQIGSLLPNLTLDYRDSNIIPTKGFLLGLSFELAKPWFYPHSDDDLEIDFYKIISRNVFYLPVQDIILASSISFGFQKNLANEVVYNDSGEALTNDDGSVQTKGRIPSIKVFRLSGGDAVRGFDDSEINRLTNGKDISEIYVQDEAFFINIKIEPRFYVSDKFMIAPFYDAGRVAVGDFSQLKLRDSVGLSFKLLTPVGTLDFDYGFKLKRERLPDDRIEKPGKFHVSIGLF